MKDRKQPYQEWLDKAEEDEFAGQEILDARRFAAPACFHFQQVAEKALKALLTFFGKEFRKVHDLTVLAALLTPDVPKIQELKEDLQLLGRYYIETRYPGNYPEFSLEEATQASAAARRIKDFVLQKIAHCSAPQ